jgi:hypothetical protein
MVSKDLAHGNVVSTIGMFCFKLQHQQLVERTLILSAPAHTQTQKKTEK